MTIFWLIALAVKSMLIAGLTLAALRLFARRSASERSLIATTGLAATLVLPAAMLLLPQIELATPLLAAGQISPPSLPTAVPGPDPADIGRRSEPGLDFQQVAAAIYLLPTLLLAAATLWAIIGLRRIRRRASFVLTPSWLSALATAQNRLGFTHGTTLLVSRSIRSPISWGLVRPVILLDPESAGEETHAEAVIAHELAHVARLDWLRLMMGRAATALFWFNPLVWMLARRSHELCEVAADDVVLRSGIADTDYAALLVQAMRENDRRHLLLANGVAPGRGALARRVGNILDPGRPRGSPNRYWVLASMAGCLAAGGAIGASVPQFAAPATHANNPNAGFVAARQIALFDTPETRALAEALRTGDWERRRPPNTYSFGEDAAERALLYALTDRDPRKRRIAVWALSELRADAAREPLSRLLRDPEALVRGEAARALGDIHAVDQADAISALLADPDPAVRLQAAHALGDLEQASSRPALEAALSDPDRQVRERAEWALRQLDPRRAVAPPGARAQDF